MEGDSGAVGLNHPATVFKIIIFTHRLRRKSSHLVPSKQLITLHASNKKKEEHGICMFHVSVRF